LVVISFHNIWKQFLEVGVVEWLCASLTEVEIPKSRVNLLTNHTVLSKWNTIWFKCNICGISWTVCAFFLFSFLRFNWVYHFMIIYLIPVNLCTFYQYQIDPFYTQIPSAYVWIYILTSFEFWYFEHASDLNTVLSKSHSPSLKPNLKKNVMLLFVCFSDELEFKEHLDLERGLAQHRDEERLITSSFNRHCEQ